MVTRPGRFNAKLAWLAVLLAAGCSTIGEKRDKSVAALRVHLEVPADTMGRSAKVPIYRAQPVMFNVENNPFLHEGFVQEAKVIEVTGGFALQIQFDHRGTMLLEQYSARNPGKHFAVWAQFGKKPLHDRWLAAPKVGRRIPDGLLVFTPDATREETEKIAIGLNNVVGNTQPKAKPEPKEK